MRFRREAPSLTESERIEQAATRASHRNGPVYRALSPVGLERVAQGLPPSRSGLPGQSTGWVGYHLATP